MNKYNSIKTSFYCFVNLVCYYKEFVYVEDGRDHKNTNVRTFSVISNDVGPLL